MNEHLILRKDKFIIAITESMITILGISFFKSQDSCWFFLLFGVLIALFYWVEAFAKEALYLLYHNKKKFTGAIWVTSGILTIFCILGYTISINEFLNNLYQNGGSLIRTFCGTIGYLILISKLLITIFYIEIVINSHKFSWISNKDRNHSGIFYFLKQLMYIYIKQLRNNPFQITFFTIIILYIPYIIASYPGIFLGDTVSILSQGWGYEDFNSHHPVFYQMILNICVKVGIQIFHSWNIGLFIYSILQMLFIISVLSNGIKILFQYTRIKTGCAIALILYFVLHPLISNYMFLASKEVLYAACIMLWIETLFLIRKNGWKPTYCIPYGLSLVCSSLIRNDGLYVVIISIIVFCFLDRKSLKKHLFYLLIIILIHFILSTVILSAIGARNGSKREMLSIPLQQTARAVWKHQDDISEKEKDIILNAFNFKSLDEMAQSYNPNSSDNIKFYFVWDIFSKEAKAFYKVWFNVGLRHPLTYIEAFIANYYHYFYPSENFVNYSYAWSQECFDNANLQISSNFHYNSTTSGLRKSIENIRKVIFNIQPFSIINVPGIITWIFIIFIAFIYLSSKTHNDIRWMLIVPGIVIMMVCFASPMNGYYGRYQFPLVMTLPWIILISHYEHKKPKY